MYQTGFEDGKYNHREFVRRHIENSIHSSMKLGGKYMKDIKPLRELAKRLDLDVKVLDYEGYYNGAKPYVNNGDGSDEYLEGYQDGEYGSLSNYIEELENLKEEYVNQDKYSIVKILSEFASHVEFMRTYVPMSDEEYRRQLAIDLNP